MKIFEKNNILIVRLSSIGDVILTSALTKSLRLAFPNARIDFLTSSQIIDIYRYNPHINNLFLYNKKAFKDEIDQLKKNIKKSLNGKKYDIVLDLQNNLRTKLFLVGLFQKKYKLKKNRLYKLALVNFKVKIKESRHIVDRYYDVASELNLTKSPHLEVWLENENKYKYSKIEKSSLIKIGFAPGATHFTKRWLTEYFVELGNLLAKKYEAEINLFGSKEDYDVCKIIENEVIGTVSNFAGKFSLLETTSEIDKLDLLITNDSGLMHIAAARQIPVLAIFGSTTPDLGFTPYGTKNMLSEVDSLPCRPCTHIGRSSCPKKHFRCMTEVTPFMLLPAIEKLLSK